MSGSSFHGWSQKWFVGNFPPKTMEILFVWKPPHTIRKMVMNDSPYGPFPIFMGMKNLGFLRLPSYGISKEIHLPSWKSAWVLRKAMESIIRDLWGYRFLRTSPTIMGFFEPPYIFPMAYCKGPNSGPSRNICKDFKGDSNNGTGLKTIWVLQVGGLWWFQGLRVEWTPMKPILFPFLNP